MLSVCLQQRVVFSIWRASSFWSEDLMSACVACGLCVEECCGVLSRSTAQQNELHSGFHTELSWLDSLRASDNTCEDKPLHGGICTVYVCVSVCLCVWGRRRRWWWWWGSYTSPGEHVMLLSRPETPPQSTEKMKADASLPPFLSRLFLLCIELFLCACWAPTSTQTQIASTVNLENSSQRLKCHSQY